MLNARADANIPQETRARIWAAVAQLGYPPNRVLNMPDRLRPKMDMGQLSLFLLLPILVQTKDPLDFWILWNTSNHIPIL